MRLYHTGDRGEAVRDIQQRLSALGYRTSPDDVGLFGPTTFEAVSKFQSDRGLPIDGIVGSETWRALVDAGYHLGDRLLYRRVPMMRGDDVADLQARLNSLGFDAGKVDGVFGPNSLRGLLDFQHNRELAEDGISGPRVGAELQLIEMVTKKHGRDSVRERQWLAELPDTIAGQRVYLDPECRNAEESASTWAAAIGAVTALRLLGASPIISRSIDTTPPARLRARRANRVNADIVVGFLVAGDSGEAVYYFRSKHSMSDGGLAIADRVASRLDVETLGGTLPGLKDTQAPSVIIALTSMNRGTGRIVADSIASLYEDQEDPPL